ncbi:MAG: phage tail protein, partial [Jannaschia sp.]
SGTIPVLFAPLIDPGAARRSLEVPEGATVAEIVTAALPGHDLAPDAIRVTLVSATGRAEVPPALRRLVRPKPGVRVVIRTVPGKDTLRSVLLAIVSIAAIGLGQIWGAALIPSAGFAQTALSTAIGAGLSIVGGLLVNALIPLEPPSSTAGDKTRDVYSITGWRNEMRPGEPIPSIMGRIRTAPPFAARSYTEIVGDEQYVRALFCVGYGPIRLSDLRIGETPLEEFDEIEVETREGRPGDPEITLYPEQVIEDGANLELSRPFPRSDDGTLLTDQPTIATPRVRRTARDASALSVIITFPSGLFDISGSGDVRATPVSIRIRQRLVGDLGWQDVETLVISAAKREAFSRQHTWSPPSRGHWEVEVTRLTDESNSNRVSDRCILAAVQTRRPEKPIATDVPLALIAVRVRASYQLNGPLDDLNVLADGRGLAPGDGDGPWVDASSDSPASAAIAALMSEANAFPATEAEIDWEAFREWWTFCAAKGLRYNRVHDQPATLGETLMAIGAAGRGSVRHDGRRWGVIIDRPEVLPVDHLSTRNCSDITWSRPYFTMPHAFRIAFLDETRDFAPAERIVPWPGHTGPIRLTEAVDLPGKTNPDEIWIEARRRMYELIHRSERVSAVQDGAVRVATRGDLVMASFDVLDVTHVAARCIRVEGLRIDLDEEITMDEDMTYAVRFSSPEQEGAPELDEDVAVITHLRSVRTSPGTRRSVMLTQAGPVPPVGWQVLFGPSSRETTAFRVRGLEAGEDFSVGLDLLHAAPIIDELTDAEIPPVWTGRVG